MKIELHGCNFISPSHIYYIDTYIKSYKILWNELYRKYELSISFYPLAYILFHIIELSLKHIIYVLGEKSHKTHKLEKLWDETSEPKLKKLCNTISTDEISFIQKIVDEFKKIKGYQEVFRYNDKGILPKLDQDISSLIINPEEIDIIKTINYKFLEVEYAINCLKNFGIDPTKIYFLEKLVSSEKRVNKADIEKEFEDNLHLLGANVCLRQHYKCSFSRDLKLSPLFVSIEQLKVIIELSKDILSKKRELIPNPTGAFKEYELLMKDKKITLLEEKRESFLKSLSAKELCDISILIGLGRDGTLSEYFFSCESECKQNSSNIEGNIGYILGKDDNISTYLETAIDYLNNNKSIKLLKN